MTQQQKTLIPKCVQTSAVLPSTVVEKTSHGSNK